jgi:carboxymethylenebutenolidase
MTETVQIQSNGDTMPGALERPEGAGPWPGVLVVQEWWGLDSHIRDVARRFAQAGYLALAPDLYIGEAAADPEGCTVLVNKHGKAAPDRLRAAYRALKAHPDCTGKVGAVGYCFGGRMVLHLACYEPELDAANIYYGGRMETYFDRVKDIRSPLLGIFGEADRGIPLEAVKQFDALLDEAGVPHEVVVYPGAAHAFFNDERPNYHAEAAADAWRRTNEFFERCLKG